MKSMDTDKDYVIVLICQLYHLLRASVDISSHKTRKFTDSMVNVHYVVAYFYLVEFPE